MDVNNSYNQICMDKSDMEKTSFVVDKGTYYYNLMSFGLKNVGATYQRLVSRVFKEKIRKTMEVYVDDMVVKNR